MKRFLRDTLAAVFFISLPIALFPESALSPVSSQDLPSLRDDLPLEGLREAALSSRRYYEKRPPSTVYRLGRETYTAVDMLETVDRLLDILERTQDPREVSRLVRERFHLYRSTGVPPAGRVTFSGYYEHHLRASLTPSPDYRHPIYSTPDDLISRPGDGSLGRLESGIFRPYYTRGEIDGQKVLSGRGLEIAYAHDPLDVYFLQVEGSGWLHLPDGKTVKIRYAGHNGHPYRSVGLYLVERGVYTKEEMNRDRLKEYLGNHPRDVREILDYNPRYVFFRLDRSDASPRTFGSIHVPLTPGRSIATDPALFPRGGLAWIRTDGKVALSRFVFSQDEGGAIKGPGRVDVFCGGDDGAERRAVDLWETGELYFLVRKKEPKD
ncbi:MAG TPA: MltA domain-containing protein [Elusimicrobiota bacterium]|nr:MltA domain-containing protein [Elusimicrobiota bacterium]